MTDETSIAEMMRDRGQNHLDANGEYECSDCFWSESHAHAPTCPYAAAIARAEAMERALALAGITHAAIARDGECLRKLVEAARVRVPVRDWADEREDYGDAGELDFALRACGLGDAGGGGT